jgi:hypothetical protein
MMVSLLVQWTSSNAVTGRSVSNTELNWKRCPIHTKCVLKSHQIRSSHPCYRPIQVCSSDDDSGRSHMPVLLKLRPRSWFSYVERRRRGVGRNMHLATCKSKLLVEPNASKNPFFPLWPPLPLFHFGFGFFFNFLRSFRYPVTLSVTLLHCNVRGICETTDLLNIPRAILFGGSQTVTLRLTWI